MRKPWAFRAAVEARLSPAVDAEDGLEEAVRALLRLGAAGTPAGFVITREVVGPNAGLVGPGPGPARVRPFPAGATGSPGAGVGHALPRSRRAAAVARAGRRIRRARERHTGSTARRIPVGRDRARERFLLPMTEQTAVCRRPAHRPRPAVRGWRWSRRRGRPWRRLRRRGGRWRNDGGSRTLLDMDRLAFSRMACRRRRRCGGRRRDGRRGSGLRRGGFFAIVMNRGDDDRSDEDKDDRERFDPRPSTSPRVHRGPSCREGIFMTTLHVKYSTCARNVPLCLRRRMCCFVGKIVASRTFLFS